MGLENIDLDLWQRIQDKFSEELNIPIITLDLEGKELAVSGKFPFYCQLIRSKRPELYHKKNGIINIEKPLVLYGNEVGKIICGPIGIDPEFDFRDLSERLAIGREELIDAANEISKLKKEEFELSSKFVSLLANMIPKLVYQNKKKDNEISELTALYNIIRKVNSTLELEKILEYIMHFLIESIGAVDCSVIVYNEEGKKRYFLKQNSEKIAVVEYNTLQKVIKEKKALVINNIKEEFEFKNNPIYNSVICLPLKIKEEIIGTINLYNGSFSELTQEERKFITIVADQVSMAVINAQKYEQVKELAVIDKLTNVFNRRYFTELLEKELDNVITQENPIALILTDVDHFGKYNNAHGHPKGDMILKELCNVIKESLRKDDILGRYGGEEFVILLPKIKPIDAKDIAERIRKAVENHKFEGEETQPGGKVTISVGLVVCMDNIASSELISETDKSLYEAKNNGRNRVEQKTIIKKNLKI